ncbi:glutathione S-transferase family protein [Rhizobium mesosinicum]|uniref:Glutathione S-transferase family protein n=1 Tax=Rhizobium mesosinicum TaxID=335017 RepID=A0ABS7GY78_9HYPH|nr:glutathione S-transferase family protein [Rhizobium mesosinicum]MBW9054782.1 glutathione S-transferase family protein [Rhizobium mesosinicum]
MSLAMYLHPLSSYSQKAKTAFYEKDLPFEAKLLDGSEPINSEFSRKWPIKRFPVLEHGGDFIFEATSVIEYIDMLHPGEQPLIPRDAATAIKVRMWDRFFDNYMQYPQQRMVNAAIGREMEPDDGYVRWRQALETAYAILDAHMKGRQWVASETFSLADCSAAPALLYADWAHPVPEHFENLRAYRARLLARPSYARALDEARPYRHLYPLGAPVGRD